MKSSACCIIGANYGDEGKGLMTDYFCRTKGADLVIRFNGGAQAGHTVVTPEGKSHVFSHFGSGALAGVPSYLSKYFVLNPIIFRKEREQLLSLGVNPIISADPRCRLTTPWDMMWNQYLEELRGKNKHGSCGIGINATMDRYENYQALDVNSIWKWYQDKVRKNPNIKSEISRQDQKKIQEQYINYMEDRGIFDKFTQDLIYMNRTILEKTTSPSFSYAVFEGAQGLGLDQYMGEFPYVTRSNTGMRNILSLQREWSFHIDDIMYVTRNYLTRHGEGPFYQEWSPLPETIVDTTNIPNKWQGNLRIAPFNREAQNDLYDRIYTDLSANRLHTRSTPFHIGVTHKDQISLGIDDRQVSHVSYGPSSTDVQPQKGDKNVINNKK